MWRYAYSLLCIGSSLCVCVCREILSSLIYAIWKTSQVPAFNKFRLSVSWIPPSYGILNLYSGMERMAHFRRQCGPTALLHSDEGSSPSRKAHGLISPDRPKHISRSLSIPHLIALHSQAEAEPGEFERSGGGGVGLDMDGPSQKLPLSSVKLWLIPEVNAVCRASRTC